MGHLVVVTAHVLGVSRGGQIAMDFTLERPHRVSALVMVASGPGGFKSPEPQPEPETKMFADMEGAWEHKEFERLADLETQMWVDGPVQPSTRVDPTVRTRVRAMILNNYRTHDGSHVEHGADRRVRPRRSRVLAKRDARPDLAGPT